MTMHHKNKKAGVQAFNPKTETEVKYELADEVEGAIIMSGLASLDRSQTASAGETNNSPLPGALLSDRVAALAASLDVAPIGTDGRYEPDAFIAAVQTQHDALMRLETKLSQQAAMQRQREADLQRREADLAFAEKRVKGREQLLALGQPRSWWWPFK